MKMLDSSDFGSYQECGINIAATWNGTRCKYSAMMFLDNEAPTTGGREIWGFPKKIGNPDLSVIHDTLTGTLHYAEREVALGTIGYKFQSLAQDHGETLAAMRKSQRQPEMDTRR
jgi:acetoacetate decarboxylase